MYSSRITYPVYDLNASEFLEVLQEVLQTELINQRDNQGKTFLPKLVKTDEYLLNPISDKEIDPAFCSIIKAKMEGNDDRFMGQQNDINYYIIGVLANGLENLRKIADAIYVILNDMDVKIYLREVLSSNGDKLIYNADSYLIQNLTTEYEISKTLNDKDVIYGSLLLQAQITEVTQYNTYISIDEIEVINKIGDVEVTQLTEDLTEI